MKMGRGSSYGADQTPAARRARPRTERAAAFLSGWIEEHGPYLYYGADRGDLDELGILPSVGGYAYKWGSDGPRDGHVYLATEPDDAATYGIDPEDFSRETGGFLYRVDISALPPEGFYPNENDFEERWDAGAFETIGEWAEAVGLGDDFVEVEQSFAAGGPTFRGSIQARFVTKSETTGS